MTYENIIKLLGKLETYVLENERLFLNEVSINIHLLDSKSYDSACKIKKLYCKWRYRQGDVSIRDVALMIFYQKYKDDTELVVENCIGYRTKFYRLTLGKTRTGRDHKANGWRKFKEFLMSVN